MSRYSTLPQWHRVLQSQRKRGRMKGPESFLFCSCKVLKWLLITHGCHCGVGAVMVLLVSAEGEKKGKRKIGYRFPV